MIFKDYMKIIQDNRQNIIDYYAKQFGEDKRKMFEERFDRIKWCFFTNPESINRYIQLEGMEQFKKATIEFLKDNVCSEYLSNIDFELKQYPGEPYICKNKIIVKLLRSLFGAIALLGCTVYQPIDFTGIWTFLNLDNIGKTNVTSEMKIENDLIKDDGNKELSPLEEYIRSKRCEFLKEMGCFPKDMDDNTILNSEKYKELCVKYSDLATSALEYREKVEERFRPLLKYKEELETKEKEIENDRLEIAKSRIIDGNYEPDSEDEVDLFFSPDSSMNKAGSENGEISKLIIFFNPFGTLNNDLDIHLRHEIKHAMLTSCSSENGIDVIKVGNKITKGENNYLEIFNECVTQRDALEETKESFEHGWYLFSNPGAEVSKTRYYTEYDHGLPLLNSVICTPKLKDAVRNSQVASSNLELYSVIPFGQLNELEEILSSDYPLWNRNIDRLRNLMIRMGIKETDEILKKNLNYDPSGR